MLDIRKHFQATTLIMAILGAGAALYVISMQQTSEPSIIESVLSTEEPTGAISGEATLDGEPLAFARIELYPKEATGETYRIRTNPDGGYTLTGVAPGDFMIVLAQNHRSGNHADYTLHTRVYPDQNTTVNFYMERGEAAIEGQVRLDGAPATRGNATLTIPEDHIHPTEHHYAQLDEDGFYRFEDLRPGRASNLQVDVNTSCPPRCTRHSPAAPGHGPTGEHTVEIHLEADRTVRQDVDISHAISVATLPQR